MRPELDSQAIEIQRSWQRNWKREITRMSLSSDFSGEYLMDSEKLSFPGKRKHTCNVCEGKKWVFAPGIHFLGITLFRSRWFKKSCPACLAKGYVNVLDPPPKISAWPEPSEIMQDNTDSIIKAARSIVEKYRAKAGLQCHLCEGHEDVHRVAVVSQHLSYVSGLWEKVEHDWNLCLGCRRKLNLTIKNFEKTIHTFDCISSQR